MSRSILLCLLAASWPTDGFSLSAQEPASAAEELVFSVRTWKGEYFSRDISGGVETSPITSTIYTVRTDGTALKEIVRLGKSTDAPAYSPDGRWIYFQSNATGQSQLRSE